MIKQGCHAHAPPHQHPALQPPRRPTTTINNNNDNNDDNSINNNIITTIKKLRQLVRSDMDADL